jgi:hypothetical protein
MARGRLPDTLGHMNPLGIIQAVVAAFEGVACASDPKRREETVRDNRRFLIFYAAFIVMGIGVVAWVIRLLYFAK